MTYKIKQAIFLILFLLSFSFNMISSTIIKNRFTNDLKRLDNFNYSPKEIIKSDSINTNEDNNFNIDLDESDSIKILSLKKEILNIYAHKEKEENSMRFKNEFKNEENNINDSNTEAYKNPKDEDFTNLKYLNREEETLQIINLTADSNYIKLGRNGETLVKYDAKSIRQKDSFWCSAGSHEIQSKVKFTVEFKKSQFISSMWIHWAFAPGEFKILYSNDNIKWVDILGGYRLSIKNGDVNWWNKILMNPATRWKYKSFDEKINFEEPFLAKYITIIMRIPVNKYFGIFNLEFYTPIEGLVMIKIKESNLCMSVINGSNTNESTVVAINCLQAIAKGDNRELFIINSNGSIITQNQRKCLQSSNVNKVNIQSCDISDDHKDNREKWSIDSTGMIRSMKEQMTCLTLADSDNLTFNFMKVSANSSELSGRFPPENALNPNSNSYWASNPTNEKIIFEIYFHKFPLMIHNIKINWKFPPKIFTLFGMLTDGFWKKFYFTEDNREMFHDIILKDFDFLGIKIVMKESSMKYLNKNIYGILGISLHFQGRNLIRQECIPNLENTFEIIYVNKVDELINFEYKKSFSQLHNIRNKFDILKNFYFQIPDALLEIKENASEIKEEIMNIDSGFDDIKNYFEKFEDFLKIENKINFNIGTEMLPAFDCSHIIKAFPHKRSGYYYIKNECMKKGLRVFCDFYSKNIENKEKKEKIGLDYFILKNTIEDIKDFKDIRMACNEFGLDPLEIKNKKTIKIIQKLIKENLSSINDNILIPIGYDYSCDDLKCSKIFKSFNTKKSKNLNDLINISEMRNSLINLLNEDKEIQNTIGFVLDLKLETFQLSNRKVTHIICSSNKEKNELKNMFKNLECDTNLKENELELYTHYKFICPINCRENNSLIYGTNIYTDFSSICKSAIHSGVIINNEGGIIELIVEPSLNYYKSSLQNNIESFDYDETSEKSFRVNKYIPYCPINRNDRFKLKESSFLNLSENTFLVEELKNDIQEKIDDLKNLDNSDQIDDKVKNIILASELLKLIQKQTIGYNQNNLNYSNTEFNTDEAIKNISLINFKDQEEIESNLKFSEVFKNLISRSNTEILSLTFDKNLGLNYFTKRIHNFENKLELTENIINLIEKKSNIEINKIENKVKFIKKQIINLYEDFFEDYSNSEIEDKYEIYNSKKGNIEYDNNWQYKIYDNNYIINYKGNFEDLMTGSHLIIKNKDFYDFEIKSSFMIKESKTLRSTFGICFRYKDSFNYFILEFSKGFKRIIRFLNGVSHILDIIFDGGFEESIWYNIRIKGVQNNFKIYSENNKIFDFEDQSSLLMHGTFAFATNGEISVSLDKIKAIHLKCKDELNENNLTKDNFITSDCPRFFETFNTNFEEKWRRIDPIQNQNGPSEWNIKNDIDNRNKVLSQNSLIFGISPNEEGSFYLLDKICQKGKISLKFKVLDEGIIGVIFRYNKESENYYILEISNQFIRIRRKIGQTFTLLSINQILGYKINIWMKLILILNENSFNVFIADLEDGKLLKVFENEIKDNIISYGTVGLSTYKTRAYFDEISLNSLQTDDYNINNILYVDREKLNLPSNKINLTQFERLNKNIQNFSWSQCVKYGFNERNKLCEIIHKSQIEIEKCYNDFCESCCNLNTDATNQHFNYLCKKQCHMLDNKINDDKININQCSESLQNYKYSDSIFKEDFFQTQRCKIDMCNLCCVSFDFNKKSKISKLNLEKCHQECIITFDKQSDK